MAICPYCGSQIGDEAKICGFCGGKLTLDFTAAPEENIREISEVSTESEYESIPDDILGSVLGSLGMGYAAKESVSRVPAAAESPEIPPVDELFDVPAVGEAPDAPVFEEIPLIPPVGEAPAVEEASETFAATGFADAPVIPAEAQPAAVESVYAQPVEKKKNSWLLPAIIVGALALICILFFATRGGGSKSADPNLGSYKATVVKMYGMELDAENVYDDGFIIELKANGTCEINSDGQKGKGKWTLEGDKLSIDDGHNVITGTLSDGVLVLENMLDMGLDMIMEKQE